jgi:cysteine desulfurase
MAIYLDCNATTPIEERVLREVLFYMTVEFGNAGSRTHEFGTRAKKAVEQSRATVAKVVGSKQDEVIFTSGATESNNIAIFGIAEYGEKVGKKHIITTPIEHKAVLEPIRVLSEKGFEVTFVAPNSGGWVDPEDVRKAVRKDTVLVSIMHVNNETGVIQPISEIAGAIENHEAFFHVDAAQGFGKDIITLQNERIDLISISAHKIYGPKGIGALIARQRSFKPIPLSPLMYGGGQERCLRPGTLPVHLIVGLGIASELALKEVERRNKACRNYLNTIKKAFEPLVPIYNGEQTRTLPNVVNVSFPNLDSEAVMVALKDIIAISSGSACTSQNYELSHVLKAMGLNDEIVRGALRISWCHMSEHPNWEEVVRNIKKLY